MKNRLFQRANEEKKSLRREVCFLKERVKRAEGRQQYIFKKMQHQRNMLEDVVNELDLSAVAIENHGPLGTPPAELVRLVLEQKNLEIAALKAGFNVVRQNA